MTSLTRNVRRTVHGARGDLVIELTPAGVRMKEKGRRTWYGPGSYDALLSMLAKQEAAHSLETKRRRPRRLTRGLLST